jgi:histidinol dehydrogenase
MNHNKIGPSDDNRIKIEMKNIIIEPLRDSWPSLIERPLPDTREISIVVKKILNDVKENKDSAIARYALQFDGYSPSSLLVTPQEIADSENELSDELKDAIKLAKKNIEKFHKAQRVKKPEKIQTADGVTCWRKNVPIERVGLYIPGGSATLFSTLLMLAIPAKLAGCTNIAICTPPHAGEKIHPAILYVAKILGLSEIYRTGGAQAIAALAYGTESIQKVDKIFGPGNNFVTYAKKLVSNDGVAIDMLAGPSELAVYADKTCISSFVAADLLSQAEHGADSQVFLVSTKADVIESVIFEINHQMDLLPRKDIINQSLLHSRYILIEEVGRAFELLNYYAPEHLIIASKNANKFAKLVKNAGSVFLGNYSSESCGDYASGTNHSLPTNGTSKTVSGVSVDSFVKKITFQSVKKKGIKSIGPSVEILAEAEGLAAHKNAVTIRLKSL